MALFNINDLSSEEVRNLLDKIDGITSSMAEEISNIYGNRGSFKNQEEFIGIIKELNVQNKYIKGIKEAIDVSTSGTSAVQTYDLSENFNCEVVPEFDGEGSLFDDEPDEDELVIKGNITFSKDSLNLDLSATILPGQIPVAFPVRAGEFDDELTDIIVRGGKQIEKLEGIFTQFENNKEINAEEVANTYDEGVEVINDLYVNLISAEKVPFNIITGQALFPSRLPLFHEMLALEHACAFRPVLLQAGAAGAGKKKVDSEKLGKEVFFKICGALGIIEVYGTILEIFNKTRPKLMKELGEAMAKRNIKKLTKIIKKILKLMTSKRFLKLLTAKVGRKLAAKIVGKIAAKAIPILGWAMLIGNIIAVLISQVFF